MIPVQSLWKVQALGLVEQALTGMNLHQGASRNPSMLRHIFLALHLRQIALLALVALGCAFHEF